MTERWQGFTVVLEKDLRCDDAEFLLNAIKALRYVADVQPITVVAGDHMARERVRHEFAARLLALYRDFFGLKQDVTGS